MATYARSAALPRPSGETTSRNKSQLRLKSGLLPIRPSPSKRSLILKRSGLTPVKPSPSSTTLHPRKPLAAAGIFPIRPTNRADRTFHSAGLDTTIHVPVSHPNVSSVTLPVPPVSIMKNKTPSKSKDKRRKSLVAPANIINKNRSRIPVPVNRTNWKPIKAKIAELEYEKELLLRRTNEIEEELMALRRDLTAGASVPAMTGGRDDASHPTVQLSTVDSPAAAFFDRREKRRSKSVTDTISLHVRFSDDEGPLGSPFLAGVRPFSPFVIEDITKRDRLLSVEDSKDPKMIYMNLRRNLRFLDSPTATGPSGGGCNSASKRVQNQIAQLFLEGN